MSNLSNLLRTTIINLADGNKKRWSHFTGDAPMTFQRFSQRVAELKVTKNQVECQELWAAFNVSGREMAFRDFVYFLQAPQEGQPQKSSIDASTSPTSILHHLKQYRRQFLDYCLQIDPSADGYVGQKQISDFLLQIRIGNAPSDHFAFISTFDPENSGSVNYFEILYSLSSLSKEQIIKQTMQQPQSSVQFKSPGPRHELDPSIFTEFSDRNLPHTPEHETGARGQLDPSIFGDHTPSNESSQHVQGGRGNLDPAIFGEKPTHTPLPQQPIDDVDLSHTRDCTEYNNDQTISLISRIANTKFRSMRDCFGKWRGNREKLDAADIFRGMAIDGGVELSTSVLDSLLQEYGGELTVSGFTRFISEGARINAPEPVPEVEPPPSERDILMNKIATGLKGKNWEAQVKLSKNALDLANNLKKLGVTVKSADLRDMYQEVGIKGIIADIKARQAPKKKKRV